MPIQTVGIIGAGTMGSGIAQVCATAKLDVILTDVNDALVEKGVLTVGRNLDRLIAKNKLSAADKEVVLARIKRATSYDALASVDVVIEAAIENFEVKRTILKRIDSMVRPDAIVASNTSSVSITKLAAAISHSDRFIGMHFFNPVPVMGLVEVVRGMQTSDATHDAVETLATKLGKTPITVRSSPGFVVNRILLPMLNEAFFVLAEGETGATDIDQGMKLGCNHPIGPLALADLIGLDVVYHMATNLQAEYGEARFAPPPLLRRMVLSGYLGRKSRSGFYDYAETPPRPNDWLVRRRGC